MAEYENEYLSCVSESWLREKYNQHDYEFHWKRGHGDTVTALLSVRVLRIPASDGRDVEIHKFTIGPKIPRMFLVRDMIFDVSN